MDKVVAIVLLLVGISFGAVSGFLLSDAQQSCDRLSAEVQAQLNEAEAVRGTARENDLRLSISGRRFAAGEACAQAARARQNMLLGAPGALVLIIVSLVLLVSSRQSNLQRSGIVQQLIRKSGRARAVRGSFILALASLLLILNIFVPLPLLGIPQILLITIIALAAGVAYILLGMKWLWKSDSHPVMKKFAQHGDPQEIIKRIETELANGAPSFYLTPPGFVPNAGVAGRRPKYFFTSFCLLAYERNTLIAVPYGEIVWAYVEVIRRLGSLYQVRSKTLVINDRQEKETKICVQKRFGGRLTQHEVELRLQEFLLEQLARYAPWAFFGFSEENRRAWYGQNRQAMISAVELARTLQATSIASKG